MHFWKFNSNIAGDTPKFPMPKFEYFKQQYKNGNTASIQDLMQTAIFRTGGWAFSFRDEMKKFVVKCDGELFERWAPNKTLLRKNLHHKADYILEVPYNKNL